MTGMVSPQYHIRFDSLFETIKRQRQPKSEWQQVCHFRSASSATWQFGRRGQGTWRPFATDQAGRHPETPSIPPPFEVTDENIAPPDPEEATPEPDTPGNERAAEPPTAPQAQPEPPPRVAQTRSGRTVQAPSWHSEFVAHQVELEAIDQDLYVEEDWMTDLYDPILYANKASNDPDTLYMHEALKAPDAADFKKAMVKTTPSEATGKSSQRPTFPLTNNPSGRVVNAKEATHRHEGGLQVEEPPHNWRPQDD